MSNGDIAILDNIDFYRMRRAVAYLLDISSRFCKIIVEGGKMTVAHGTLLTLVVSAKISVKIFFAIDSR